MSLTILEAIKEGIWDFEPDHALVDSFDHTEALPGTDEKLNIMADRLARGEPLWHPSDCLNMEEKRRSLTIPADLITVRRQS